jgi:LysR family transcriptional regulator, glycine cleavage system transcriptional activator
MTSLRFFEAAARLGSFSAAASELSTSNSAVSYHIHGLERFLGKSLFVRQTRRVCLTEEGRQFQAAVIGALDGIASAAARIANRARAERVAVQVGPYFSAAWLTPRLQDFHRLCPGIDLDLHHATTRQVEEGPQFDLSILWGTGKWRGRESQLLMPVEAVPVCSPDYRRQHPELQHEIERQTAAVTLLHYESHDAWAEWFRGMGLQPHGRSLASHFDEPNVLHAAAIGGQGVAIGFLPLIDRDLRAKRLVIAHRRRVPSEHRYFLVYRRRKKWSAGAEQFVAWIKRRSESPAPGSRPSPNPADGARKPKIRRSGS